MNNNKGFAPIITIIVVLGVVLVGGGIWYTSKYPDTQPPNTSISPTPNNPTPTTTSPKIIIISPNGGEIWKSGESQTIKWNYSNLVGNVLISLKDKDRKLCNIANVSVSSGLFTFAPTIGQPCPINTIKKLTAGTYNLALFATNGNNEGDYVTSDESDSSFIISSENSSNEVFKNQPGAVKSITANGNNQWILAVDLVTLNPDWIPGGEISYFINQNPQIRNLNVTGITKAYNCKNTKSDLLANTSSFIADIQNRMDRRKLDDKYRVGGPVGIEEIEKNWGYWPTAYFDINGTTITAIYEQCLP